MRHRGFLVCRRASAPLLAALFLSGCGGVRYPASYLLNFPQPTTQTTTQRAPLGEVVVRRFQCPEYLCQGRIVYRPSPEEVGFYEYHRWVVNPRESITQFMADALRTQSLFKDVMIDERGIEPAYVLTGRIEHLDELDRGRDVLAECAISAELVDVHTGSVIWSDRATETLPLKSRDVAGVVNGITAAARIAVDRLVKSIAQALALAG